MYYSTIGILAFLILIIENQDILFKRGSTELTVWKVYRRFLLAVLVYYATDILWGIIESQKFSRLLFIDTLIYFIAMAVGVFYWTQYAVTYLDEDNSFGRFLMYTGRVFLAAVSLIIVINIFTPVLFEVDSECVYRAKTCRYVLLGIQILLLLLISVHAFLSLSKKRDASGKRYRTIALFGIIMALFLTIQLFFPYLPLYSIAYMLGLSLLHSFVVNDEKEDFKHDLERSLEREKMQHERLKSAMQLAYTDPLTGVKNKHAFIEAENDIDRRIDSGLISQFAVVIFDLNDLKKVNDSHGHELGDRYIIDACRLICSCFKHSPVYRIGGDEFAAIAESADYNTLDELLAGFDEKMANNAEHGLFVIASGCARFDPRTDNSFSSVFERADEMMYIRKRLLKQT
ncbi:MAG: GGDEF domain-containing protein [Oscillospiraceae bacterium]|nr:GGDEF domain-containing protein [Oscillospiraceae bacterium]